MISGDGPVEPGGAPSAGWRRAVTNLFLIVFVAIQLVVPLRGFVLDKFDSRADLSWNMYSKRYSCRVNYVVREPGGRPVRLEHKPFFRRESAAARMFHRDVLPNLHEHLCRELREDRRLGELRGSVRCMLNGGPREQLVRTDVDLCSTKDYGVIR